MKLRKESIQASLFGFIVWGSWAYYINLDSGNNQAIISGAAQAISSGTIGYLMTEAIALLHRTLQARRLSTHKLRGLMYSLPISAVAFSFYITHSIAGTENILITIAPSFCIASLWTIWCTEVLLSE